MSRSGLWGLPHTNRFFVAELQIFCRCQIGLKSCRTLADFLSRLTEPWLEAESSKSRWRLFGENWKKTPSWRRRLFTWLSWQFLIGWGTREPRKIVLVHRTLAGKRRFFVGRQRIGYYATLAGGGLNEIQAYDKHHKVSSLVKSHQNIHNSVKYENVK